MNRLLCIVAVALASQRDATACTTLPPCEPIAPLASADAAMSKLAASDGAVVARAAVTLAASDHADQLATLGRALRKPAVLARIMKTDQALRCVMPAVLGALAANPSPAARKELISLVGSPAWAEQPGSNGSDLQNALLRATGRFRPVAPEITAMWERMAAPHEGWVNVTTMVLAENATPEAAALFERLLRDPEQDLQERIDWLHSSLVAHRDRVELLAMVARLLDGKLPAELVTALIEGVFDYQQQWYGTCPGPTVVALASYSPEARAALHTVAAKARAQHPAKPLAAAIDTALRELDRLH